MVGWNGTVNHTVPFDPPEGRVPERRTVMIRSLDVEVWAVVRAEAERRRWDTAAVVEHIVREWLACHGAPPARAEVA